jgi:predicted nucleic acid-binding protein
MLRLVVDTSVVVAALRSSSGASSAVLVQLERGRGRMLATVPLFLEYESVLKRADQRLAHGLSMNQIDDYLDALAGVCEPVTPTFSWRPILGDPNDEMIVDAALNGGAKAIVTHNARDFAPALNFGVQVWSPARALKELRK